MSEMIETHEGPTTSQINVCEVCDRLTEQQLHSLAALPERLQSIIAPNAATPDAARLCSRCLELFSRAQRQIESHASVFEQNDFVLPTPLRMDVDERFTGAGVTIAFLDSGFYAHADLTEPRNRIAAYHSIFSEEGDSTSLHTNDVASWQCGAYSGSSRAAAGKRAVLHGCGWT